MTKCVSSPQKVRQVEAFEMDSASIGQRYLRETIRLEGGSYGEAERTLGKIARSVGVGVDGLQRILSGKRKSLSGDMLSRFRKVYHATCESQIKKLEAAIAADIKTYGEKHDLVVIRTDLEALRGRLEAAKGREIIQL